jgi:hypothetical protein
MNTESILAGLNTVAAHGVTVHLPNLAELTMKCKPFFLRYLIPELPERWSHDFGPFQRSANE